MATETAAELTEAPAPTVPETASKQPHKLERKWAFWFDNQSKPKQGAAWGSSMRKIYTFDTVEEFWCLYDQIFRPSQLPANADFHLFKAGIEPKWEDPECANGGMLLETLMALIGEQFDEATEHKKSNFLTGRRRWPEGGGGGRNPAKVTGGDEETENTGWSVSSRRVQWWQRRLDRRSEQRDLAGKPQRLPAAAAARAAANGDQTSASGSRRSSSEACGVGLDGKPRGRRRNEEPSRGSTVHSGGGGGGATAGDFRVLILGFRL